VLNRITNETSGAYTRYSLRTIGLCRDLFDNPGRAGEAYQITYFDGAGRVRVSAGDHPGSSGLYAGSFTFYDVMGRVSEQDKSWRVNRWLGTHRRRLPQACPSTLQTTIGRAGRC
jgi:hypothetical protein